MYTEVAELLIDALKEYFENKCPLTEGRRFNINCLDSKVRSCALEPSLTEPIVKKYADGGSLRQYEFIFATREYFDNDVRENTEAAVFYERLAEWVEGQNRRGDLPTLGNGLTAVGLEVCGAGYLYKINESKARYQIQLRLLYEKE